MHRSVMICRLERYEKYDFFGIQFCRLHADKVVFTIYQKLVDLLYMIGDYSVSTVKFTL